MSRKNVCSSIIIATINISRLRGKLAAADRHGKWEEVYKKYRQIHILAKLGNDVQQMTLTVGTIALGIISQPISLVALIRLQYSASTLIPFMFVGLTFLETVLFMVVCVGGWSGSGIYQESKVLLRAYNRHIVEFTAIGEWTGNRNRWAQRFIKSCQLIKIRFGSLNFIEERTPLNCLDFANNLTVELLLLTK